MDNYNRDVHQAEQKQMARMVTASQRQTPYHLGRNSIKQARGWLSEHVGGPIGTAWSSNYGVVSHRLVVLYRRASTRAAGLVLNALEELFDQARARI